MKSPFTVGPRAKFLVLLLALCTDNHATAQEAKVAPLFDQNTKLEPWTIELTDKALITRIGDRVRDRHARESAFKAYDHYLSFYWEQKIEQRSSSDLVKQGHNGLDDDDQHVKHRDDHDQPGQPASKALPQPCRVPVSLLKLK